LAEIAGTQGYLRAWDAIGELLRNGRSWSGRERSCGFLNTRDGRFATTAAVTRLDDPADARALAVTDWDRDGDLDVWTSHRTGPRLRLYRNPSAATTQFLKLRLTGVRCNRDAIGAQVDVTTEGSDAVEPVSRRFVRAGEGYLAQSTKWLHFGRGNSADPMRITIAWPDGTREQIDHVRPNRAYQIVQGSGRAEPVESPPPPQLTAAPPAAAPSFESARIVVHGPLPLPELPAHSLDGTPLDACLLSPSHANLLVLWASWCQPCLNELHWLGQDREVLAREGLHVWAGNVENMDEPLAARLAVASERLQQVHDGLAGGLLTREAIERLDLMQRVVLSRQESLAVPTSFLLDAQGRLIVIYRGPVDPQQLRADLQLVRLADPARYRDRAVPFAGRWYINPAPVDLLAVPNQLRLDGQANPALDYLRRHVGTPQQARPAVDANWYRLFHAPLATAYTEIGIELARKQQPDSAQEALQTALEVQDDHWNALAALASLYGQQQAQGQAIATYERMLQVRPRDLMTANNLAWLLATSPDPSLRDPQRAVRLAETVCEATRYRLASALDTLAAAYAAANRLDDAIRVARQALQQLPEANAKSRTDLQQRLRDYENDRARQEPSNPRSP
jgi:tetratricopeptide (TPR) repeat protein